VRTQGSVWGRILVARCTIRLGCWRRWRDEQDRHQ
jgi:hypothetical protein